ncbi:MAG: peptidoglycan-binding protein [Myxococcales bacterium]|nr:peptidoglycan-binding protein [Myxococcales bacterium]
MSVYVQYGSKGRAVRALQEALNEAGYSLDVDGDFGDGTDAAVRDFQSSNELDVDGVVGPDTWSALGVSFDDDDGDGAKDGDDEEGYEEVGRGAEGDAVSFLQETLVAAGYELDVDGIFGRDTERAVRDFQSNHGLDVDGIVGDNTWAALEEFMGDE